MMADQSRHDLGLDQNFQLVHMVGYTYVFRMYDMYVYHHNAALRRLKNSRMTGSKLDKD